MSANKLIHNIYFYIIMIGCVIAFSVSTIAIIRQILVDTIFTDLRDTNYSYIVETCPTNNEGDKKIDCDEWKKQQEENQKKNINLDRQNTYLTSTLTIVVSSIVFAIHFIKLRPKKYFADEK